MQIVRTGPDDERFTAWCRVWAATQRAERPDEAGRLEVAERAAPAQSRAAVLPGPVRGIGRRDGPSHVRRACGPRQGWRRGTLPR